MPADKSDADKTTTNQDSSSPTYFLAGAVAGLVSDGIVHPIDTIRARLQVQRRQPATTSVVHQSQQYHSATDALRKIARAEGVSAFYRGFGAVALGTIPGHALYFAGYEVAKRELRPYLVKCGKGGGGGAGSEVGLHLVAGLVADVFGSLAWTPMDVVKQRLQVVRQPSSGAPQSRYRSSWHALGTILREEGVRGLYRGFGAGLLVYGPYVSIYFALYEEWKRALRECPTFPLVPMMRNPHHGQPHPPPYTYWLGAAGSGAVSAVLTCPLDVIKTRVQVGTYRNAWEAIGAILRQDGWRAFWQGVKPRALWMASGTAITMVVYEELKRRLP